MNVICKYLVGNEIDIQEQIDNFLASIPLIDTNLLSINQSVDSGRIHVTIWYK